MIKIKEIWLEYLAGSEDAEKLYQESDKLYGNNPKKSRSLFKRAKLLKVQTSAFFFSILNNNNLTIIEFYENKVILSNGVILYYDGTVYEPLEVVMKRIIDEEESKS